jgi:hypothetical protein
MFVRASHLKHGFFTENVTQALNYFISFFSFFLGGVSFFLEWDSLLTVQRELFPPDTGVASDKEGPQVIASL